MWKVPQYINDYCLWKSCQKQYISVNKQICNFCKIKQNIYIKYSINKWRIGIHISFSFIKLNNHMKVNFWKQLHVLKYTITKSDVNAVERKIPKNLMYSYKKQWCKNTIDVVLVSLIDMRNFHVSLIVMKKGIHKQPVYTMSLNVLGSSTARACRG